jgi:hypothetical protein
MGLQPTGGLGSYRLGPSARTTHLNLRSVSSIRPFKLRSAAGEKFGGHVDGGFDGVFVEAEAEVAADEPGVADAVAGLQGSLGVHRFLIVLRMVEDGAVDDLFGGEFSGAVEGDEVLAFRFQILQAVHPVGDADGGGGVEAGLAGEVPGGPAGFGFGHDALPGVEHDFVGLVGPGAEQALFVGVGIPEQFQGLVGVGADDNVVETFFPTVGKAEVDAFRGSEDFFGGLAGEDVGFEEPEGPADVGVAAAGDDAPLGAVFEGQQSVVLEKVEVGIGGEIGEAFGRGGPDGGAHGEEVAVAEDVGKVVLFEEGAEGELAGGAVGEGRGAEASEAAEFAEEGPVVGGNEMSETGEDAAEGGAGVGVAAVLLVVAEGHVGVFEGDVPFGEKAAEMGVVPVIHDYEAGVDGCAGVGSVGNGQGAGVAANSRIFLEEADPEVVLQQPGGGESGDAGADDGDPGLGLTHVSPLRWKR